LNPKTQTQNFLCILIQGVVMSVVPTQIIAPLATISLGVLSLIVRWIAGFQLEGTGSDFALIATSLQLSRVFARIDEFSPSLIETLQLDLLVLLILLILWGVSIKNAKSAFETRKRILREFINPYSLSALIVGSIALFGEISWRLQFG